MSLSEVLLTEQDAAAYLSISKSTIRRWRSRGVLPPQAVFSIGGIVRYRRSQLDFFIEQNSKHTNEEEHHDE